MVQDSDALAVVMIIHGKNGRFLHPAQRSFAYRSYNGPARVAGSAGTGKTVVAIHRALALHKYPDNKIC